MKNIQQYLLSIVAILIALMALIIAIGIWYNGQSQIQQINNLSQQQNQQQLSSQKIEDELAVVAKQTNNQEKQAVIGQVSFLLQLADLELNVNHDIKSAEYLLNMTLERLRQSNDPSLLSLTLALNSNLEKLKAAPRFNKMDLIKQLDEIDLKIQNLSLLSKSFSPLTVQEAGNEVRPHTSWVSRTWSQFLSTLKSLVIIHRTEVPVRPIMTAEEQDLLKQAMQAKIMQIEWAILHQDSELYRHNLTTLIQWITNYFGNYSEANKVQLELNQLLSIDVAPLTLDLSAELKALTQIPASTPNPPKANGIPNPFSSLPLPLPSPAPTPAPKAPPPINKQEVEKPHKQVGIAI